MKPARLWYALPIALAWVAVSAAPIPIVEGTSYRVDPKTARAGFDLRATLHTVHGTTGDVSGSVKAVRADGHGFDLEGSIRIQAASLDTGNVRRDRKMREESLRVSTHPEIVFQPSRLVPDPSASPPAGHSAFVLEGSLTVRGVAKPVKLKVEAFADGNRLVVEGGTDLAWADFGVPDPSFAFVRIAKQLHASFHVELVE
jgi:polyisoprenoid-binding protein YceI